MFIDLAKTDFSCPHCNKKYDDGDDYYLKRCNKNKSFTTKVKCSCSKSFRMTYSMVGQAVSFI